MLASALLVASLLSSTPALAAPEAADPSVGFLQSYAERSARLVPGLELQVDVKLPSAAPLAVLGALALDPRMPLLPLDTGGGVSGETRQILALVLGLVVGFGLGHFVARDREGFVLFLVVDIAIIAASAVLHAAAGFKFLWIGLLVSHIIQGLDAYGEAGGPRIVEKARERSVDITPREAWAGGPREQPAVTTRTLGFAF